MKTNRRAQAPKRKIDAIGKAEVERARSNAGQPHKPKTQYNRNDKSWKRDYR